MSFGRKGLAPGQTAPAGPRPATRIDPEAAEIAARREAFLAAERARRAGADAAADAPYASDTPDALAGLRNGARPATRQTPEAAAASRWSAEPAAPRARRRQGGFMFGEPSSRSLVLAYLFWFILGQLSLHRFYCGQKDSALMQLGLFIGSLVVTAVFPPLGMIGLVAWLIWVLADLFLIPGMMRRFKDEHAGHYDFA